MLRRQLGRRRTGMVCRTRLGCGRLDGSGFPSRMAGVLRQFWAEGDEALQVFDRAAVEALRLGLVA